MDIEIGTQVVETEGFFKGIEFTVTGEYLGTCDKFGERKLIAPKVAKPKVAPKVAKPKRTTDVQKLQQTDAAALEETITFGPHIYIYCQPSIVEREAARSGFESRFIKPTSELSHGAKYDIIFADPVPFGLMTRLASEISDVDIENNRICSRNLSLWLIEQGVTPELPA